MPKKINLNKKSKKKKPKEKKDKSYFKLILSFLVAGFMFGSMFMAGEFLQQDENTQYNNYEFEETQIQLDDGETAFVYEVDYHGDILEFIFHPQMIGNFPDELSSVVREENKITLLQPKNVSQIDRESIEFSYSMFFSRISSVYENIRYDAYLGSLDEDSDYAHIKCNQSEFYPILKLKEGTNESYWDDYCYVHYVADYRNIMEFLDSLTFQMLDIVPVSS